MNPPKIIICGNYGATNLGDEAILDGILTLVMHVSPAADVTVLSARPKETENLHRRFGVKSCFLFPAGIRSFVKTLLSGEIWRTLDVIRKADLFILGGGGLFTDEKKMAIVIWSLQARIALFMGKPIFCFAQSIGPLRTSFGKFMTRKIFRRARMITLRDSGSAELLRLLKVGALSSKEKSQALHSKRKQPFIYVLADPAFTLSIDKKSHEKDKKYVVISVRTWKKESQQLLNKKIAQFSDWLWEKHRIYSIFIPFQRMIDNDTQELNKIFEQMKNKNKAEIYQFSEDYQKVMDLIIHAQAVVGMRLHSLIFSTIAHKPFLALSYSTKVRQFVEDVGMGEYVINVEDDIKANSNASDLHEHTQSPTQKDVLTKPDNSEKIAISLDTPKSLEEIFQLLLENYEKIEQKLIEKSIVFKKKASEHEKLLKHLLSNI